MVYDIHPYDRIPPQSLEMEQAVLGSMLIERQAIEVAAEMLVRTDFYREAHGAIFMAILDLMEKDEPVDVLTVQEELKRQEILENCGGAPYLVTLTDSMPTAAGIEAYARVVEEKSLARAIINASRRCEDIAHSDWESSADMAGAAELEIQKALERRTLSEAVQMRPAVAEAFERIEFRSEHPNELAGIPSGFEELDALTGGFQKGDLVIIGARPSMGKTSFLLTMLCSAARKIGPVMIFSLEMSAQALTNRMIASESGVGSHILRSGNLKDMDWRRIGEACANISEMPMWIEDSAAMTVPTLKAKLRRVRAEAGGLHVVGVDYLQLMHSSKGENRTQEVGHISRGLKQVAREFNIPVIALSQLSRQPENRANKRPQLSDLRESGDIEADADVCLLIYRDKDEDEGTKPAEIIVAKQRNGPTGVITLGFNKGLATFENYRMPYRED